MLVEQFERQVLAERQVAAIYNASGNYEQQPLPGLREQRELLDSALNEEPDLTPTSVADLDQLELRQVLGVA